MCHESALVCEKGQISLLLVFKGVGHILVCECVRRVYVHDQWNFLLQRTTNISKMGKCADLTCSEVHME